ncbi:rhamnogalacturonidase [Christiangramia flava]|uniref:Polygalacturonase n=1 Tax=Christiangramia flava JLT2011 TaxID=1229726 RepID=A0A1L7I3L2_9FLAO|nr:glycoside hydrolase family 28 protein [Christiangramia flava]APU68161.1 Polygalacturonase [Christiangramia flava JLT2011]OSS41052.1 Polygalacturonase [Christiangramia flava JLT2011]
MPNYLKKYCFCLLFLLISAISTATERYNIKDFGAAGDGTTLDTEAINKAITAAAKKGGGMVYFPTGTYLSYSIRLKSNIHLFLEAGSILKAAGKNDGGSYDAPGKGAGNEYQDYGHSYWRNSLIWGENLDNVTISGPGTILGENLSRGFYDHEQWDEKGIPAGNLMWQGGGNKAIALKLCTNVILKDFTIIKGGHFGILATGVDNFTIDNLKIDTNRDGIDIDSCKNVRISNCTVNSPNDDAICLKSSFALGYARPTENVTITNCQVSGYDVGTLIDGTFKTEEGHLVPDQEGPTGRIKFGTESNGGFKNITISNCVFDRSRGLALETVDGGLLEDVTISNITMRNTTNSPFFLRLAGRMRGPEGVEPGELRRVNISNINVYNADSHFSSIVGGIPGHNIKNVRFSNINIWYKPLDSVKTQIQKVVPEHIKTYPEPAKMGIMPSYGFFLRHVENVEMHNINIYHLGEEVRPALIFEDVRDAELYNLDAQRAGNAPILRLKNSENIHLKDSEFLEDQKIFRKTTGDFGARDAVQNNSE